MANIDHALVLRNRATWLDSGGYQNCASDVRRGADALAAKDALIAELVKVLDGTGKAIDGVDDWLFARTRPEHDPEIPEFEKLFDAQTRNQTALTHAREQQPTDGEPANA